MSEFSIRRRCPHCQKKFDIAERKCPFCGHKHDTRLLLEKLQEIWGENIPRDQKTKSMIIPLKPLTDMNWEEEFSHPPKIEDSVTCPKCRGAGFIPVVN